MIRANRMKGQMAWKTCVWLLMAMLTVWAMAGHSVVSADWPQLLGPSRDGHVSEDEADLDKLPSKLKIRWEAECGEGYAGPNVHGNAVYLVDRAGEVERMRRFDRATGSLVWTQSWPATYEGGIDSDRGPRCVPAIAGERIVAYGAAGRLVCLDLANGAIVWSRDLRKEYQAEDGYFGAGSSPLIVDDRLFVAVGGKRTGGVVALNLADGATFWESVGAEASYASPIVYQPQEASRPAILIPTRLVTYLLDARKGDVLFQTSFGQRGPTVNAATPVVTDSGQVVLTASYGIGMTILQPNNEALGILEQRSELLRSQYATPIVYGSTLFGSDGREDYGNGQLRCIELDTLKVAWETNRVGIAHLIGFPSSILAIEVTGRIVLFRSNAKEYLPLGELVLPAGTYRALPAYSDRVLYVRSSGRGQNRFLAIDLDPANK